MSRKPKFKPRITRVKLNPEQAVLQCDCFDRGWWMAQSPYNYFLVAFGTWGSCQATKGDHVGNMGSTTDKGCFTIEQEYQASS
jgi:hypothetical protein